MKTEVHSESSYIGQVTGNRPDFERNNCVPKALAALTRKPYTEVYGYLEYKGRRQGKGTPRFISEAFLKENGFVRMISTQIIKKYVNGGVEVFRQMTLATFAKTYTSGRYMVYVRSHAVAVIDGKILDDWNSAGRRVTGAWEMK
jgi:hypothetical protein